MPGERSKTSLKDIFKDGYVGILVKPSGERIASIFDLKKSRREHGLIWREGVKMRKAISKRKILMYAIKRRVDASAAATPDGRLQEALSKLEEMRLNRDPESGRPQQKPRSLQQLINILSDDETGEIMPMQYEKAALLWDACKPMQGGNPKQRSKVSLMEEDQQ